MDTMPFPHLVARNLEGVEVVLPAGFEGAHNVVAIAFKRHHQPLVDSWVPWFDEHHAVDPTVRFYEVPTIGRMWAPVRNFIDGGMAAAIREPVVLRRTLTVYGDVGRVTGPLGIDDRSTITVLLVDDAGVVHWRGAGGHTTALGKELDGAIRRRRG